MAHWKKNIAVPRLSTISPCSYARTVRRGAAAQLVHFKTAQLKAARDLHWARISPEVSFLTT